MNMVLNRYRGRWFVLGAVLVTSVLLPAMISPAIAQSQGSSGTNSEDWKFIAVPYVLLPWMDGNAAVLGQEVKVDVPPSKIFQSLQFAAMGYFEARKGKWGAGVDAVYMALGTSVDQPAANLDINQGAYTFIGLRQLNEKVDLVFGARWNVIQGKLAFKGPLLTGTSDETKQWVEPIVGLKLGQPLRGPLSFTFEGDIGGFGAGSDFAWNLLPAIGVDVSKHATLKFGYRVLSEDYETGSGAQKFKYDVITQAMVFGAAFKF